MDFLCALNASRIQFCTMILLPILNILNLFLCRNGMMRPAWQSWTIDMMTESSGTMLLVTWEPSKSQWLHTRFVFDRRDWDLNCNPFTWHQIAHYLNKQKVLKYLLPCWLAHPETNVLWMCQYYLNRPQKTIIII
jgi:hypothetical protein